MLPLNEALVWRCQNSATGHAGMSTLLTTMQVPPPSRQTYCEFQDSTYDKFQEASQISMKSAAEEEKSLALLAGDTVEVNVSPFITVTVDGQWSKRCYGHGSDANSGSAVIIGEHEPILVLFASGRRQKNQSHILASRTGPAFRHQWNMTFFSRGSKTAFRNMA